MFQIEITCDADKTIKLLDNFDIGTKTFEEPLIQTAEYMQIQALLNFQTEGETMGERWPPLADSTKKFKEKNFPGQPMMVRTGTLQKSFFRTPPFISENSDSIIVYNPVSYAIIHQKGNEKLPRRVLLKLTKNHLTEVMRIFNLWIIKIIANSFNKNV